MCQVDDVELVDCMNGQRIPYSQIREAANNADYPMEIVEKDEIEALIAVVNQGIDSRLQACNVPDRGDSYLPGERSFIATEDGHRWKKGDKVVYARFLDCVVSPESLPVLIRRLFEHGSEPAENLARAIMMSLDIEIH